MIGDIERLTLVQHHVIKLRRLAAETSFDSELALRLHALADEIEKRTREADRRACSPN
jgi:hypothetical protein